MERSITPHRGVSWLRVALIAALGALLVLWFLGAVPVGAQESSSVADPTPVVVLPGDTADAGMENPVTGSSLDLNVQIAMWLAILGFIASPIISFINRYVTDSVIRALVAFTVALALALLDTIIRGTLNTANLLASLLIVFTAAIGFYNQYFKPSGMAAAIEGK